MRQTTDPGLIDFYNDMNEHGMASYWKVGDPFVIEVDTLPSGAFRLVVWRAVEDESGYVPPDGMEGNRYAWDAVGSKNYDTREDAERQARAFGSSEAKVREWCEANPYDGPRRPYSERHADA